MKLPIIKLSFEEYKELSEKLARYLERGTIKAIDESGRITLSKKLKGRYLLLAILKHNNKELLIGYFLEPEEVVKYIK